MARWYTLVMLVFLATATFAQKKGLPEKRDPSMGWYLPMKGQAFADGQRTRACTVELFRDNRMQEKLAVGKKGDFHAKLDFDAVYTLRITQPGHQTKLIHINTALDESITIYPPYNCLVNLLPIEDGTDIDPFYVDFPSAIVRYDQEMGGFYHSDHYLAHIHTKLGSYAQVKP